MRQLNTSYLIVGMPSLHPLMHTGANISRHSTPGQIIRMIFHKIVDLKLGKELYRESQCLRSPPAAVLAYIESIPLWPGVADCLLSFTRRSALSEFEW
jgi:hypothetical protein